jgi:hypothetical protein
MKKFQSVEWLVQGRYNESWKVNIWRHAATAYLIVLFWVSREGTQDNYNYMFSILCIATDSRFKKLQARIVTAVLTNLALKHKNRIISRVELYSNVRSRNKSNTNSYTSIG